MPTAPTLVLVHSPLVGRLTWQPTAEQLRERGYQVIVPSLAGALDDSQPHYQALAERVTNQVTTDEFVLIGHSGAGALLPAIAAISGNVSSAVYVDAILAHPGSSWFDTAPRGRADQLRGMARDGVLPPWNEWFQHEDIVELIPDAELRIRFLAEIPKLPLSYFAESAPVVAEIRGAYVQLSEAYGREAIEAERRGWPTYRQILGHLAMLTKPTIMADLLEQSVFRTNT